MSSQTLGLPNLKLQPYQIKSEIQKINRNQMLEEMT